MNHVCPIHNEPWKTIPSGISKKTGRSYNSFQVCPHKDCTEKPSRVELNDSDPIDHAIKQTYESISDIKPDWDAIARGKVRNSVACALLSRNGVVNKIEKDIIEIMETWVNYIMNGPEQNEEK